MHKEANMRTTLDIPENLITEAMQLTSIKTKTALIIRALEELVRKNKIAEIKKYKGRIDLDVDLDVLRNRK
ncbi:MAG: type II toxin-antitoxin system VapB family antitoxin [Candidatus Electrothrix sp.]